LLLHNLVHGRLLLPVIFLTRAQTDQIVQYPRGRGAQFFLIPRHHQHQQPAFARRIAARSALLQPADRRVILLPHLVGPAHGTQAHGLHITHIALAFTAFFPVFLFALQQALQPWLQFGQSVVRALQLQQKLRRGGGNGRFLRRRQYIQRQRLTEVLQRQRVLFFH